MKDDYSGKSYGERSKDDCFDCYSSQDHMPPGPKMLHVIGKCKPNDGFIVGPP